MISKLWRVIGRVVFWVSWPVLYFYLQKGVRTRVLIVCDDHVVVLRNWLGGGKWSLPGGGLHRNEIALAGAVREVREETGLELSAKNLVPLGPATSTKHGITIHYEQFCIRLSDKLELKPEWLEVTEVAWLPISSLDETNAEQATVNTLENWHKQ